MSEFDVMPINQLSKLVEKDRLNLKADDAGTEMTHLNDAQILVEKASIARRLNKMAFYLSQRDGLASEDLGIIAGECRPYLIHASNILEPVYTP